MSPGQEPLVHRNRLSPSERFLLQDLRVQHTAATGRGRDTRFQILRSVGHRYAVCEYGARYYDGGIEVFMAVELSAGGVAQFSLASAWAMRHPRTLAVFFEPELAEDDDPVRTLLAARPTKPIVFAQADWDVRERCAALELVRIDHPELIPPIPPWSAGEPAAEFLFGSAVPSRFGPRV